MLSAEQITELAWGLELSCQRFIWVVRPPTRGRVDDAFFNVGNSSDGTPNYLPEGFSTRIRDVGLLVPLWAPQVEILSHSAVGEQRLNATFLVEEAGVAVRPRVLPTKQVVGREEIERLVRSLIEHKEGQGMRDKAKQLKMSAEDGLGHAGSSYKSMCEILSKLA
ncbi:UNVERIFIED_CONTAM: Anthocyanidin 3-O-glucosyltransferase 5 [Sesamum angustifolium]|uniref:Anthocyanidin 3-O-glucosyltransferase 5 n=1 Tax=Sesamum angustifolium TaxID=2727405 RepID=A0AAW2RPB3_9LAMI